MEDRAVVVAVETVLQEVAGCEGDLLCPELEGDVACGCVEDAGGCGLGFEVVEGGHSEGWIEVSRVRGGVGGWRREGMFGDVHWRWKEAPNFVLSPMSMQGGG